MKSSVFNSDLYRSKEKEIIRKLIAHSHPRPYHCLTFGGRYSKDAKLLTGMFPHCSVRVIERDKKVYNKICREVKAWPSIFPANQSFSQYVKSIMKDEAPFDIVFLDYQGIISVSVEKDIETMFKKCFFKKQSIIALTLSKSHDSYSQVKKTYCFRNVCVNNYELYKQDRGQAVATTVIALAEKHGYTLKEKRFKELENRTYNNTYKDRRGSPMMFFMFKVV